MLPGFPSWLIVGDRTAECAGRRKSACNPEAGDEIDAGADQPMTQNIGDSTNPGTETKNSTTKMALEATNTEAFTTNDVQRPPENPP